MHLDVVDLRAFYYRTKLGRATQRSLQTALREMWPDTKGLKVAGFGFAAPMLRPFLKESERVLSLMPGQQGVMHWPPGGANLSTLIEEANWPLAAGAIDRLIVAHGLETCEMPDVLLSEIWRILAPGGRVIFIVPNRAGIWAQRDVTPFGYGRPYSVGQLESYLRLHRFQSESHRMALYSPPSSKRFWLRSSAFWERRGKAMGAKFMAGAILLEVSKQVYAMPPRGLRQAVRGPVEILQGLGRPKPKPVNNRDIEP